METPRWFSQLLWSPAELARDLDANKIPCGAGIYAFTSDPAVLTPGNVLYIGKADGARQTLRTRIGHYRRRFAAFPGGRVQHRGMEQLAFYYATHGGLLYLRWTGVVVARDIEGSLIDLFDPCFNNKSEHRHGFADDESIPEQFLY